jgi:uncharacterized protein (DUF697 family)
VKASNLMGSDMGQSRSMHSHCRARGLLTLIAGVWLGVLATLSFQHVIRWKNPAAGQQMSAVPRQRCTSAPGWPFA